MTGVTVKDISARLASGLCRDDDACAALCVQLLRLLADGQPVSRDRLAAALGVSRAAVDATLRQVPNVEADGDGRIVASGLSLLPTPHQFHVNGHDLYTWCALDTLMYPVVLGQRAQVASRCPVSGAWVRLIVTPERIEEQHPSNVLVSIVVPDAAAACCDVRGAFCQHVSFFAGADAGEVWRAAHPETTLLSVEDAYIVGNRSVGARCYAATGSGAMSVVG
jgi:alkylmercury lyase